MNNTQQRLGKLIDAPACRDAVHVAVLPIVAAVRLAVGASVQIIDGRAHLAPKTSSQNPAVGIVDPFLDRAVYPGDKFWLYLYPNTVSDMTHQWSHPVIDKALEAVKSIELPTTESARSSMTWLKGYLAGQDGNLEDIIQQLSENTDTLCLSFVAYGPELVEFWEHLENALGVTIPDSIKVEHRFSCSC